MAALAGAALLSHRKGFAGIAIHLVAIASGVAATGLAVLSGGTASPRFGFLLALPPLVLAVVPELPWASGLAGAVTVAGGLAIVARERRGAGFASEWAAQALAVIAISAIGAVGFRKLWFRQLQAHVRHSTGLLRLAESERRRERAERFALVAKLAARLAHELANPLAAVKVSVACLAEAPSSGAEDPQATEALAEARAGVERIGLIAADLRDLGRVSPGVTTKRDVSKVLEDAISRLDAREHARLRVRVAPRLHAVVDGVLLAQCIRHLVLGGASLGRGAIGSRRLCLDAARSGGGISIELGGCELVEARACANMPVEETAAVAAGSHAGLHLAFVDELARAMGGAFETFRSSDGLPRFRIRLSGPTCSAGES